MTEVIQGLILYGAFVVAVLLMLILIVAGWNR